MFFKEFFVCEMEVLSTHPAKMAPRLEINHSGLLKPIMPTPCIGSRPSCEEKIQAIQLIIE